MWFYFGHSGYEYIDLGRAWQIALLVGLLLWLLLMAARHSAGAQAARRAAADPDAVPHREHGDRRVLRRRARLRAAHQSGDGRVLAVVGRAPLGRGFFEVFATVVIAFLFARLKLVRLRTAGEAARAVLDDLPRGRHHRHAAPPLLLRHADHSCWRSARCSARWKSCPLLFVGFEAWQNLQLSQRPAVGLATIGGRSTSSSRSRSGICVGAGLFGFMINPPIALYYMQGLNTTPLHGHAALFGVYGMLGMGLMLFSLRALRPGRAWRDGIVNFAFWSMNIGPHGDGRAEPAAGGPDADVGVGRARLLVRAQRGVPADRSCRNCAGSVCQVTPRSLRGS